MKSLQASKIYISCFVFLQSVQLITALNCEMRNVAQEKTVHQWNLRNSQNWTQSKENIDAVVDGVNTSCIYNVSGKTMWRVNLREKFYMDHVIVISEVVENMNLYVYEWMRGKIQLINKTKCNEVENNGHSCAKFHGGVIGQHIDVHSGNLCEVIIIGYDEECSSTQITSPRQTTESITLVSRITKSISMTTQRSSAKTTTGQSTTGTTMQFVTKIAQKTTTQRTTTESQGTTPTGQKTTTPLLSMISAQETTWSTSQKTATPTQLSMISTQGTIWSTGQKTTTPSMLSISTQGTTWSTGQKTITPTTLSMILQEKTTRCEKNNNIPNTKEEAQQKLKELRKELTVDKKKTNVHYRKLTSAPDDRPSSQTIGWFGAIIISLPILLCIVIDLTRCRSVGKKEIKTK